VPETKAEGGVNRGNQRISASFEGTDDLLWQAVAGRLPVLSAVKPARSCRIGPPVELAMAARLDAYRAVTVKPPIFHQINRALREGTDMRGALTAILNERLAAARLEPGSARVEPDNAHPHEQTLLIWHPATAPHSNYVRAAIKVESGAKSAPDPNREMPIRPYVDDDLPALDLTVPAVRTVEPERTFWDNVVILHGLRSWFDSRGELKGGSQRVSRHYCDLHWLTQEAVGTTAAGGLDLCADGVAHARVFFNRHDFGVASAAPGSFALMPYDCMVDQLRTAYRRGRA
jgi:hypothetical protein